MKTANKDEELKSIIKINGETATTVAITINSVANDGVQTEITGSPLTINKVEDGRYLFVHTFDTLGTYTIKYVNGDIVMNDSIIVINALPSTTDIAQLSNKIDSVNNGF